MKIFIVLSALVAVGLAKPSAPLAYTVPLAYAKLLPGAPIGLDGRVVDTPEVSFAKAEHAAAHLNEKLNLAKEAVKSADYVAYAASPLIAPAPLIATTYSAPLAAQLTKYTAGGAPIGLDGRVVDTPEVAYAKAEHAAAHINHNLEHNSEFLRNSYQNSPLLVSAYSAPVYANGYIQHYL
ncbi:cuticle protein 2-like [Venturia canescens]|uniref:cuticle protein 2-like n=1 Tax=Venturia canescens TaxID=32260 RepID=UPI001C9C78E2|nr:cuticle protein 2-like [Venturia canescens]